MASFTVGIGSSKNPDAHEAGKESAEAAHADIGADPGAAIVLASASFNQEDMLAGVRGVLPEQTPLIGCTTAGEILPGGPQERSVAVLLMRAEGVSFYPAKAENISDSMRESGEAIGRALKESSGEDLKGAFVFSDGLSGNGTQVVRGLLSELGVMFPFIGGAAGDDGAMKKTYQYYGDTVLSNAVVALGMAGDVGFVSGARSGWKPVGAAYTITKAEGQLVKEINGKPAFSIYEDAFGKEKAQEFRTPLSFECVSHPLGMKVEGEEEIIIRAPFKFGDDGSIMLGAEAIEGAEVYLMVGTITDAQTAVELNMKELQEKFGQSFPSLVFVSECLTRKILFGEKIGDEFNALKTLAGEDTPIFGLFSYGQFAPFATSEDTDVNKCDPGFYEQSVSLALIG